MTQPLIPNFKWAQDKDNLYISIELGDVENGKVDIKSNGVSFRGTSNKKEYGVDLELHADVDEKASSFAVKPRVTEVLLKKAPPAAPAPAAAEEKKDAKPAKKPEKKSSYWPQLLKDKNRYKQQCQIDWSRWVDEDEEGSGGGRAGMEDFDFGRGFGGMGGMGGDDEGHDSDDDNERPDLEPAKDDDDGDDEATKGKDGDKPKDAAAAEPAGGKADGAADAAKPSSSDATPAAAAPATGAAETPAAASAATSTLSDLS